MATDSTENFSSLFEASLQHLPKTSALRALPSVGEKVQGSVIRVGKEHVFLDIGTKTEAMMSLMDAQAQLPHVQKGDVLQGQVVSVQEGAVLLGSRLARSGAGPEVVETAFVEQIPLEGTVTQVNKGGLTVLLPGGTTAFLPASQVDVHTTSDLSSYVGRTVVVKVTKFGELGRNVVVSRRAVLEQERQQRAAHTVSRLVPGAVLHGVITSVRDYGAFVEVGGIEGLIPAGEMAYGRNIRPSELVSVGQNVEVAVLRVEPGAQALSPKVSFSLKALQVDPFQTWVQQASVGQRVTGRVVRIEAFGAFVELFPGIEGLLPLGELADRPIKHPKEVVQVGQSVEVTIIRIEPEKHRLALSLVEEIKQARRAAVAQLALGDIIPVVVEKIEAYGVLVRVPGQSGGEEASPKGMIPNAALALSKNQDVKRQFPIGTTVHAMVQSIESDGRIRLSLKAVQEAEEKQQLAAYTPNASAGKATWGDLLRNKLSTFQK